MLHSSSCPYYYPWYICPIWPAFGRPDSLIELKSQWSTTARYTKLNWMQILSIFLSFPREKWIIVFTCRCTCTSNVEFRVEGVKASIYKYYPKVHIWSNMFRAHLSKVSSRKRCNVVGCIVTRTPWIWMLKQRPVIDGKTSSGLLSISQFKL